MKILHVKIYNLARKTLRRKFIAIKAYTRKENKQAFCPSKEIRLKIIKYKKSWRNEIKTRAEINEKCTNLCSF